MGADWLDGSSAPPKLVLALVPALALPACFPAADWNPQMDLQAQARAHRMGQTKEVRGQPEACSTQSACYREPARCRDRLACLSLDPLPPQTPGPRCWCCAL